MKKLNLFILLIVVSIFGCGKNEVVQSSSESSQINLGQFSTTSSYVTQQILDYVKSDPFVKVSQYQRIEYVRADYAITIGGSDYFKTYKIASEPTAGSEQEYSESYDRINHPFGQSRTEVLNRILEIMTSATLADTSSSNWCYRVGDLDYCFNFRLRMLDNPVSVTDWRDNTMNKVSGIRVVWE